MNGIGLLVLISLAAQVGANTATDETDYGWEIRREQINGRQVDVLEYIVQLHPDEPRIMLSDNKDHASDMPPELVGRVTRVAVRIGTGPLPRSPSLAEIERTIPRYSSPSDVTAQLDPGRFSDVEADSIRNVQDPGFPRMPQASSSSQGSLLGQRPGDVMSNLADRAQQATGNLADKVADQARQLGATLPDLPPTMGNANTGRPGDAFLQGAGSGRGAAAPSTAPAMPSLPGTGPQKFNNTGQTARADSSQGALPGTQNWQAPPTNTQSAPNLGQAPDARLADNRGGYGRGQNENLSDIYGARTPPSLAGNNGYVGIAPQRTPTSTFGSTPGAGNNFAGNQPNYIQPNNGQQPNGAPGYGPFGYGGASGYGSQAGYAGGGYGGGTGADNYGGGGYGDGLASGRGPMGAGQFRQSAGNQGQRNQGAMNQGRNNQGLGNPNAGYGGGLGRGDGGTRVAANTLPSTGPTGKDAEVESSSDKTTNQANGEDAETNKTSNTRSKTAEGFLQVFFLLSLVVNFYLGMLIRKLLTKYRTLLSSVRGQSGSMLSALN